MPEQLPPTQSLTFSFLCGLQFSSSQITRHTYTYTLSAPPPPHTHTWRQITIPTVVEYPWKNPFSITALKSVTSTPNRPTPKLSRATVLRRERKQVMEDCKL